MDEGIFRKAIGKQRFGRVHFLKMAMVKLEARVTGSLMNRL